MNKVYVVKLRMKKRIPIGTYTSKTKIFGRYWDRQIAEKIAQTYQKERDKINFHTLLQKILYKVEKVKIETNFI